MVSIDSDRVSSSGSLSSTTALLLSGVLAEEAAEGRVDVGLVADGDGDVLGRGQPVQRLHQRRLMREAPLADLAVAEQVGVAQQLVGEPEADLVVAGPVV